MKKEELQQVLELHLKWLRNEQGGIRANLSDANLRCAYLSDADLSDAFKVPIYCRWTHGITQSNLIHIGCEKRTIEKWDLFFAGDEVLTTQRDTQEFKQIQAVYEAYKAYLTFLNK
jgi:hypothetical protein